MTTEICVSNVDRSWEACRFSQPPVAARTRTLDGCQRCEHGGDRVTTTGSVS
jgi:hypothetical protein